MVAWAAAAVSMPWILIRCLDGCWGQWLLVQVIGQLPVAVLEKRPLEKTAIGHTQSPSKTGDSLLTKAR